MKGHNIHGAREVEGRLHPVLDIRHWESEFPLPEKHSESGHYIASPGELALREQVIHRVKARGDLGPSVPSDVFVWADTILREEPWLTRLGGRPWRPKGRAWPKDKNGVPLVFLGQICFADSKDIVPCALPGDVALIFGTNRGGWISIDEGSALEWSPLKIEEPDNGMHAPWTSELPYCYQGVVHRTRQYTSWKIADPVFQAAGYGELGGSGHSSMQATSIGTYADLPQGWPFEEGDGRTLIATLSSFYFQDQWPLCDVPSATRKVFADGRESEFWNDHALAFGVGDAGCIWIYRDESGEFGLSSAC